MAKYSQSLRDPVKIKGLGGLVTAAPVSVGHTLAELIQVVIIVRTDVVEDVLRRRIEAAAALTETIRHGTALAITIGHALSVAVGHALLEWTLVVLVRSGCRRCVLLVRIVLQIGEQKLKQSVFVFVVRERFVLLVLRLQLVVILFVF